MAAYVVVFYSSHNIEDVTLVIFLANFIILCLINLLLINIFITILDRFRDDSSKILMGLIFMLFAHYMKVAVAFNYYVRTYFTTPLVEWSPHLPVAIYSLLCFALGCLIGKRVREFSVLISLMMVPTLFQLVTGGVAKWMEPEEKITYPLGESGEDLNHFNFKRKKNVFFILLDSYTSPEGLRVLGSDQKPFLKQLRGKGFRVYDSFYTNFQTTRYAMPAYFNMSLKNEDRLLYETSWPVRSRMIAGESQVYKIFRNNGYKMNMLLPNRYLMRNQFCSLDLCTPPLEWFSYLGLGLLRNVTFPNFLVDTTPKNTVPNQESFINILERIMDDKDERQFTYLHFYLPNHVSEFLYGVCEEKKQALGYFHRLKKTNRLVLEVLKMIEGADPHAMIIFASDHGPTLFNKCAMDIVLKTKEEIIERQGAFLAIKWGDDYSGQFDEEIKTSANLFRYIFSYLLDDESILQGRVPDDAFYKVGKEGIVTQSIRDGKFILDGKAPL